MKKVIEAREILWAYFIEHTDNDYVKDAIVLLNDHIRGSDSR